MERRFVLALALSLLILVTWSAWVSKTYHIENKEVTIKNIAPIAAIANAPEKTTVSSPDSELLPSSLFPYSRDKFEITFSEPLAAIKEVTFKTFKNAKFSLGYAFFLKENNLTFKKESLTQDSITFVSRDQTKKIIKKFIFFKDNYDIQLEINVQNESNTALRINLPLVLGLLNFAPANHQAQYYDVTIATQDKIIHQNGHKNMEYNNVQFLGLRDRYFCVIVQSDIVQSDIVQSEIVQSESGQWQGSIVKKNAQESEVSLNSAEAVLMPGQQMLTKFRIYLGPQELQLIKRLQPKWSAIIYYGTFDFIAQIILQVLEFLYRLVHNWGWAIVILSILVYLLLYPLTLKQMRSMKEMQALQPKIEELRKACQGNPQKLNKEIMELYRLHKVNPFGGCLPLILQMPIFFALYPVLMRSVVLKGARFLWIKDLSEPDRLFVLPQSLPLLGNEINILPIIMAIGMFIQQKISLAAASSGSAEQQKIMLVVFPLMFGFIFYRMPSGLVLYWFINSGLMLLYQSFVQHRTSARGLSQD